MVSFEFKNFSFLFKEAVGLVVTELKATPLRQQWEYSNQWLQSIDTSMSRPSKIPTKSHQSIQRFQIIRGG